MKSDGIHMPVEKLERLVLLYYNINKESAEYALYYEKGDDYIIDGLDVSRLTVERYINILIGTGRVYVMNEDDGEKYLFLINNVFLSLDEICTFIKQKETTWSNNGVITAEKKRLLHLIRLIGWMDLFYEYGKISELEIKKHYSEPAKKRMIQRDFKFLRELESIHMDIHREYMLSDNNQRQWYYIV